MEICRTFLLKVLVQMCPLSDIFLAQDRHITPTIRIRVVYIRHDPTYLLSRPKGFFACQKQARALSKLIERFLCREYQI